MNTEYIVSVLEYEGKLQRWWNNFLDDLNERGIQGETEESVKSVLNDELKKWNACDIVESMSLISFKSEEDFTFFLLRWS